jgi:hypothetical protein
VLHLVYSTNYLNHILSYGTPYLLSLELSKELTALVWLAGPLSGLLVQPLIGAFSDKCTSRFGKRRPFIVVAGILTCLSMLGVAYARDIGDWVVSQGSYEDEQTQKAAVSTVCSLYGKFLEHGLKDISYNG